MLKTFRKGGIHPPENKLSAGNKIENADLPNQAVVLLSQHIGAPALPVVKKGDQVKTGTLIGQASGFVSANIHSPVSGTVIKIDTITDVSGYKKEAVFIDVQGDEWEQAIDRSETISDTCNLSGKEIIEKIKSCGIVGLGGATFPTHVKLSPPPGMKATILLINAVECEPYLTADHRLLLEKGKEILIGTKLLMKAANVDRAVIGIENNKADAIDHLKKLAADYPSIEICPLKVKYPQGSEKQLIDAIIKKQILSGGLPVSVGAIVQNAGTVFAVYEAVQKNKPLIERIVTVTGDSVTQPSNFRVRIGTPVNEIIKASGGIPENTAKIIFGGPMMGKAFSDTGIPVTKGCSGIVMIDRQKAFRKSPKPCIRCGKCIGVCPMGLEPVSLMNVSEFSLWEKAEELHIMDCIECGSCSYTCPSYRPLLDLIRLGKNRTGNIIRNRVVKK